MNRRELITRTGTAAVLVAGAASSRAEAADPRPGTPLDPLLQPYLAKYELPALAAAVVLKGGITAAGAVGVRRAGTQSPVSLEDRFHIGSDTKAMTALVAAMLVEAGKLRWDSTVADIFPELSGTMVAALKPVTLEQLLSHTSGIPSDNQTHEKLLLRSYEQGELNLDELRYWLVKELLQQPLQSPPGEKFAYANMGYVLAGAMHERVGGASWEELVATRVFDPLGLKTAGFGPQSSLGRLDAPLGHKTQPDGTLKPMSAGPNGDNPAVLGPAGTAHLSILDFAVWAGWNAGEGRREPALVRPETLRKLHTPVIDMPPRPDAKPGTPSRGRYALGWGNVTMPFTPEPFVFHGGSNELNLAYIMLQPNNDLAMVMTTNIGGAAADKALVALAEELYQRFGAKP
jgi:CubicO group peptidase (beta-lactamase class C family)